MDSRSESEGEIIESDQDFQKATTILPSTTSTRVNQKLREALSPSPPTAHRSPYSPAGSAHSPHEYGRDRYRSNSPYHSDHYSRGDSRRSKNYTAYSDKRHGDSRKFPTHYEGRDSNKRDLKSFDGSYDDRNQPGRSINSRPRPNDYDDRRYREEFRHKRRRTRSRSPAPKDAYKDSNYRHDNHIRNGSYARDIDRRSHRREQSVSERGNSPRRSSAQARSSDAKMSSSAHVQDQRISGSASASSKPNVGFDAMSKQGKFDKDPNGLSKSESLAPVVPEALSIEERRKRREAIKAKYKSQTAPLLVQALQPSSLDSPNDSSAGMTPITRPEGRADSLSAPSTPNRDSAPGSPPSVNVADDLELANRNAPEQSNMEDTNEPSAADYDPSMDMQEDFDRQQNRQTGSDLPAASYDEVKVDAPHILEATRSVVGMAGEPPSKKQKREADDMFASEDEDEDDMFAPLAPNNALGDGNSVKAGVPRAKVLDKSLLDNWDDPEGYYRIILGELLDGRYHVQANLGKGMFSSVVRAMDSKTEHLVAIKIIRNNETMLKAAQKEMDIIEKLSRADPEDKKHMIRLERSFNHKGHLCMVFENLSINLREVLKKFGRDVGINLKAVRSYAQQIFLGLSLLRKCNILHADLKPDNILVNDARNMLKICDLGSAADASESDITPYLVSRFYRAPEIILGIPPDFAIDMWSIGCTLFEMYTGKILFTGRTNNQMLRSIMECRGKFSLKILKKAEFGAVHFDDANLNFRSVERDKLTGRDVTRLINFVKPTRDLKSRLIACAAGANNGQTHSNASNSAAAKRVHVQAIPEQEMKEINLFADLLDRCLALNPEKRLTPQEALRHPFIHRGHS